MKKTRSVSMRAEEGDLDKEVAATRPGDVDPDLKAATLLARSVAQR